MIVASISDEDGLLLHCMASLTSRRTGINCMAMVKAAADGISLHDLKTHARDLWIDFSKGACKGEQ